jgi:hypothetical protein
VAVRPSWSWRIFNIFMRLCGLTTALAGALFLAWDASLILAPGWLQPFNPGIANPHLKGPLLVAGVWFLILGLGILRARTYRPDLGDASYSIDPYGAKLRRVFPPTRSWWTGDPRAGPPGDSV